MTGRVANAFQAPAPKARYRDAAEITRLLKPQSPLYLFCPGQLRDRAAVFLQGFPGTVSYAVKANAETRILNVLYAAGIRNFDVASLAECATVFERCAEAELHFNNPVKAEEAVREAYLRYGVRSFALDEAAELEKIWRATGGDREVTYSIRFRLGHAGAAYDFGSKFGADEDGAVALLKAIQRRGARPALTFHPGSQCTDATMYNRYITAAARICQRAGVWPETINVGGGFAQPYRHTSPPPLPAYFSLIDDCARQHFPGTHLMCEPGRAMVAASTSLLTRVVHVRDKGHTLFLNDGVYGGLQEQSVVDLEFPSRVWRGGEQLQGRVQEFQVFGPTCDPVDRLAHPLALPAEIRAGDYIEFGLLGAYGSATATTFNGFQSSIYTEVESGWPGDCLSMP